jgi:transposase-like protein
MNEAYSPLYGYSPLTQRQIDQYVKMYLPILDLRMVTLITDANDEQIRKLIYTTNAVEGFHRQVRKVTKTKGVFPNDMALMKLIYLAVINISKKWTQPLHNWALTAGQLRIKFGDRMPLDI